MAINADIYNSFGELDVSRQHEAIVRDAGGKRIHVPQIGVWMVTREAAEAYARRELDESDDEGPFAIPPGAAFAIVHHADLGWCAVNEQAVRPEWAAKGMEIVGRVEK